jgi:hypothetical protein
MAPNRQWRPLALLWLVGTSSVSGCMPGNYLSSTPTPHGEVAVACQTLPACQRDRVHVFFVNGLDPRHLGKLDVTRDYVQRLGFHHTYFGELYNYAGLEDKIHTIHHDQPDALFVLVGFSFGANLVKIMAQDLKEDGINIDLLVYLAGDTLENTPEYRPENVHRIVNVTGQGCIWSLGGLVWDGVDIDGADNLRLKEAGHYDVPTHLKTLALLTPRLGEVAVRAGPPPLAPVPPPSTPTLPPPRKVPPDGEKVSQK